MKKKKKIDTFDFAFGEQVGSFARFWRKSYFGKEIPANYRYDWRKTKYFMKILTAKL